jgi:hypothetical protein
MGEWSVTWCTTQDIHEFADRTLAFLATRPIEHTVLLTETAYLSARARDGGDQLYGWWSEDDGRVAGAFLQAPRHAPVVSDLSAEAMRSLPAVLPDRSRVEVAGSAVDAAVAAWRRLGTELTPRSRLTVHRLVSLRRPFHPRGRSRVAGASDRDLLVSWFQALMAGSPDDPTELAYVVDDPLERGGITLWEVEGEPVAMAGRSRVVAGMVRLSAVYTSRAGSGYDVAATVAACTAAQRLARHVLVLSPAGGEPAAAYADLGFQPILDRVLMTTATDD